jgi:hypothetical protein
MPWGGNVDELISTLTGYEIWNTDIDMMCNATIVVMR